MTSRGATLSRKAVHYVCGLIVGMRCVTACITVLWEGALSIDCDDDSDDDDGNC